MKKIIERNNLFEEIEEIKKQKKKIVFTNGCFDILHLGHAEYLLESSKFADVLIVGLNSDTSVKKLKGDSRPINNESDRAKLLLHLACVDYVVIFNEDTPVNLLEIIKPDVYTKGADYTIETLPEAKTVLKNGGRVEFISFLEGKSTTNVIRAIGSKES